jgi:hypothetical protein
LGLQGVEFRLELPFYFAAHAVNEQDSLKVIVFVLDGTGEEAAAGEVQGFALIIEGADFS